MVIYFVKRRLLKIAPKIQVFIFKKNTGTKLENQI